MEPVLARLIDVRPDFDPHAWITQLPPMDLYDALLFQIVGQQLSVAATRRTLQPATCSPAAVNHQGNRRHWVVEALLARKLLRASDRSVRLLHVAQSQRSPATVCYLASNSKLMNPQLKTATRFRALHALSREARQVDDSMVRTRTIRHELMHVIDYQQDATGIVCELQPHSIEHRLASVARITEIW
jgi:hypothetical protein